MLTHPSSLTSFLRCEHAWHTRNVLGVEAVEFAGVRSRGSFFHALLEVSLRHYADTGEVFSYEGKAGEDMTRAIAAEQYEKRGVRVDEIEARECLAAARYQVKQLDLPAWEIMRLPDGRPCIEVELREDNWPAEQHSITHTLDLCIRKRATGFVWHVDFKTSKDNIVRPNYIDRDYQLLFARRLLRQQGIPVDGSLLLYVRSQAPTPPPVVNVGKKNEGLSTSADQLCDWATYEAALLERGEDPNDPRYAGNPDAKSEAGRLSMRDKLAGNCFAKWVPDTTTPAAEQAMIEQLVRSMDRMDALASDLDTPTRSLGYACRPGKRSSGCDYDAWCSAGIDKSEGYDVAQLGLRYRAEQGSRLYGITRPTPDPHARYLDFARRFGDPHHEPLQAFKP